jgi:hypothetical protein
MQRERIRQTPNRPRTEVPIFRLEVEVMDGAGKMFRSLKLALHECLVDHDFGGDIGAKPPPAFVWDGRSVAFDPLRPKCNQ